MQGNVLSCWSLVRWFRNALQGRVGACSLCLPFSHVHDRCRVIFSVLAIDPLKPRNRHASPFYSLKTSTSTQISILESCHARQHQAPTMEVANTAKGPARTEARKPAPPHKVETNSRGGRERLLKTASKHGLVYGRRIYLERSRS